MRNVILCVIVLLTISLTGCSHTINEWALVKANQICEDHNNIDYIFVNVFGDTFTQCKDGFSSLVTRGEW